MNINYTIPYIPPIPMGPYAPPESIIDVDAFPAQQVASPPLATVWVNKNGRLHHPSSSLLAFLQNPSTAEGQKLAQDLWRCSSDEIFFALEYFLVHNIDISPLLPPALVRSEVLFNVFQMACSLQNLGAARACLQRLPLPIQGSNNVVEAAFRFGMYELLLTDLWQAVSRMHGPSFLHLTCTPYAKLKQNDQARALLVLRLIEANPMCFEQKDSHSITPVHLACYYGLKDVLEIFSRSMKVFNNPHFWENNQRINSGLNVSLFHLLAASPFPLDADQEWYRTFGFLSSKPQNQIRDAKQKTPMHYLATHAYNVQNPRMILRQRDLSYDLHLPYFQTPMTFEDHECVDERGATPEMLISKAYCARKIPENSPLVQWSGAGQFSALPDQQEEEDIVSYIKMLPPPSPLNGWTPAVGHSDFEQLAKKVAQTMKETEVQEALKSLLLTKEGYRLYPLELITSPAIVCKLLDPLKEYYITSYYEDTQQFNRALTVIKAIIEVSGFTWNASNWNATKTDLLKIFPENTPFVQPFADFLLSCFEPHVKAERDVSQCSLLFANFLLTYTTQILSGSVENLIPITYEPFKPKLAYLIDVAGENISCSCYYITFNKRGLISAIQAAIGPQLMTVQGCVDLLRNSGSGKEFFLFTSSAIASYVPRERTQDILDYIQASSTTYLQFALQAVTANRFDTAGTSEILLGLLRSLKKKEVQELLVESLSSEQGLASYPLDNMVKNFEVYKQLLGPFARYISANKGPVFTERTQNVIETILCYCRFTWKQSHKQHYLPRKVVESTVFSQRTLSRPPQLEPLNFETEPHFRPLRKLLINNLIDILEKLRHDPSPLFGTQPGPNRLVPTYFVRKRDASFQLYSLLSQTRADSHHLLAIGGDKSGSAKKRLKEILQDCSTEQEPISLSSQQYEALLSHEGGEDFYVASLEMLATTPEERKRLLTQKSEVKKVDLIFQVISLWKDKNIQNALQEALRSSHGRRQYLLDSFSSCVRSLLLPFKELFEAAYQEGDEAFAKAKEAISKTLRLCHFTWKESEKEALESLYPPEFASFLSSCFEPSHVLPEQLGAIDSDSEFMAPIMKTFQDLFLSFTLHELALSKEEPKEAIDRLIPTYFITQNNGLLFLHPFLMWQKNDSLIAIGTDKKGVAKTHLRSLLEGIDMEAEIFSLTPHQCTLLLQASKNISKGFYLFTSHTVTIGSLSQEAIVTTTTTARVASSSNTIIRMPQDHTQSSHGTHPKTSTVQRKPSLFVPKNQQQQAPLPVIASSSSLGFQGVVSTESSTASLGELLQKFEERAKNKLQYHLKAKRAFSEDALPIKTSDIRKKLGGANTLSLMDIAFTNPALKTYQQEGVAWLLSHYKNGLGAILASEPGLGKTLQAIELIFQIHKLDTSKKPICIIVPSSIALNWEEELHRILFSAKLSSIKALLEHRNTHSEAVNAFGHVYSQQKALLTALLQERHVSQKAQKGWKKKLDMVKERILQCETLFTSVLSFDSLQTALAHLSGSRFYGTKTSLVNTQDHNKRCKLVFEILSSYGKEVSKTAILNFLKTLIVEKRFEEALFNDTLSYEDPCQVVLVTSQNAQKSLEILAKDEAKQSRKLIVCTESSFTQKEAIRNTLQGLNPASVIIDEAHEFGWNISTHGKNPPRKSTKVLMQALSELNSKESTRIYLLTGTPFVNTYYETLSLLQLANPCLDFCQLADEIKFTSSFLADKAVKSAPQNEEEYIPLNIHDSFVVNEYAKMIHKRFILVHTRDSEKIKKAWMTDAGKSLLPEKQKAHITYTLTLQQNKLLSEYQLANPLILCPWLEKVLFHPALLDAADGLVPELDIAGSGLLTTLFQQDGVLDKAVKEKLPILFFVHQKLIGRSLKKLLKKYFPTIKSSFYHGSKKPEKRQQIVQCFENKDDPLKFLILSQDAGGVGLNLPSAKVVIDLAPWWNESATDQSEARAIRAGTSGTVLVYSFSSGSSLEGVVQSIVEKKKLWKSYYFEEGISSYDAFIQAFSKEITKDEKAFQAVSRSLQCQRERVSTSLKSLEIPSTHQPLVPKERILHIKDLKMQIVPLFASAQSYDQAVKTIAWIINDGEKKKTIIPLLQFLQGLSQEKWEQLWTSPEEFVRMQNEVEKGLLEAWICWTNKPQVFVPCVYNENCFSITDGMPLTKSIRRNNALFTVRTLELKNSSYAVGIKL